eukprot:1183584-Prorocentrum_minimum.AAC.8
MAGRLSKHAQKMAESDRGDLETIMDNLREALEAVGHATMLVGKQGAENKQRLTVAVADL